MGRKGKIHPQNYRKFESMKKFLLLSAALMLFLFSCQKEQPEIAERADIISTQQIRVYTPAEIQALLNINRFEPPFALTYDVQAVKIAYMTPRPDGKLVNATGAVFIPQTSGQFPVICFQHGTQTQRHLVPSLGAGNSDAGLAGAVAASMGYVCVAADYLGLGESYIVPPYLIAGSSATTVIDMLRAGMKYLSSQGVQTDGTLYLTGYSQGGYVTMATHHELEKNYADEFQVTASAPLAGPYDLEATMDTILGWGSYKEPILMAYLFNAYDHYYGWNRLAEIFKEPWADNIPDYFDGSQLMASVNNQLPMSLDSLFTADFLAGLASGGEQDVRRAIRENSLLNFVPSAPVLMIQGDRDRIVPSFNAGQAKEYYEAGGKTNVEISLVAGDHEGAAETAIVGAMLWFESLRNK
jgi:dienelactone hydrolase